MQRNNNSSEEKIIRTTKRRVRFNQIVLVTEIPSHRTYSMDERFSTWYSLNDYRTFKLGIDFDMMRLVVKSGRNDLNRSRPKSENDTTKPERMSHYSSVVGGSDPVLKRKDFGRDWRTKWNSRHHLSLTQNELQGAIKMVQKHFVRDRQLNGYMRQLRNLQQQIDHREQLQRVHERYGPQQGVFPRKETFDNCHKLTGEKRPRRSSFEEIINAAIQIARDDEMTGEKDDNA